MAIDPETVTLMSIYRVGFAAPAPDSLAAGELYLEMAPPGADNPGGAPRLWVGTIANAGFPGNIASLVPLGVELPPPLPATAPINVDVPAVMPPEAAVGDALNCTMGNWEGEPTDYAYDWQRDGASIGALVGPDYTVTPADAGCVITCVVTATNPRGSTAAPPSNPVAIAAARAAKAEAEEKPKRHRD